MKLFHFSLAVGAGVCFLILMFVLWYGLDAATEMKVQISQVAKRIAQLDVSEDVFHGGLRAAG